MNTAVLTANVLVCLVLTISGNQNISSTPDPSQCPEGWQNLLYRCYYISNQTATWSQAWDNCANYRAVVLSLETSAEAKKIKSFLDNHNVGTNNYWTSGSNDNAKGHWFWFGTMAPVVYFNSCDDAEVLDDVNQSGHCLSLSLECGCKWIPEDCSNKTLKYICEKDADLPMTN